MSVPCDWQTSKRKLCERGSYLLKTGVWSDCNFIVGEESEQTTFKGHKLFLAMSSPVFEAMFFGGIAEKNDPIPIRDVRPEAFKALLEYIYTEEIELTSFELACELCYCGKKYMLPSLVEKSTKYMWSDLSPEKVCRAYEFAKLFEEPGLMEKCLDIIRTKTTEILKDSSWEEIELGTLLTILDQDKLQIKSEMELFTAIERWAKAECTRKSLDSGNGEVLRSVIGNAFSKLRFLSLTPQEFANGPAKSSMLLNEESLAIFLNMLCTDSKKPMPEGFCAISYGRMKPIFRDFLNPRTQHIYSNYSGYNVVTSSRTNALNDEESSSMLRTSSPILVDGSMNKDSGSMSSSTTGVVVREGTRYYCLRSMVQQTECLNTNLLDCSVTFSVDKNICVVGVQVPTQIAAENNWARNMDPPDASYNEILYAHLLDCDGSRLTYTHFTTKAFYGTLVEITFNRPIHIQKHKVYRVGVVFNKAGWYPIGVCPQNMTCDTVFFSFGVGNSAHVVRDGLIRSIVFSYR